MTKKTKITISILIPSLVVIVSLFLFFQKKDVIEEVKRQIATALVYEYIPNQNMIVEKRDAYLQKDSIYTNFRKNFRFPYQIIGLASFADSSRIILLTEPPPKLEIDTLHSIFDKFTHKIEIKKHSIGYDGFVNDICITLANATQENVENLLKKITKELYFSDYKTFTIDLSKQEKKIYFSKSNLDYQISLAEFDDWFLKENEEFIDYQDSSKNYTINSIFQKEEKGIFYSKIPGFVAWAIDKSKDLSEQLQYVRPFTLDADLILGGFADSNTLVIIGREREATINELPPLRIESILLLASITEKELSQSLDINDLMAGKMSNGHDWCPTYLSKELENTEIGDLLTLTDILLKNWSESGTIKENYYRYPNPGYYPFSQPLFKMLKLNELVYNWNTNNAMYAIDYDSITIYTLNRTGSLPVSYFNSQERSYSVGRKYENQAYQYFATLNNSDLVRVVQYTALYQLFMDNNIHYKGDTFGVYPKNKPYLLLKPTHSLLEALKNLANNELENISDSISRKIFAEMQKEKVIEQLVNDEKTYHFTYTNQEKENIFKTVLENQKRDIIKKFKGVQNILLHLSEEETNKLARQMAYPRGISSYNGENYQLYLKGREINMLLRTIGKNNLTLLGIDLKNVKDFFSNNLSQNSAKYLKTPSLIITMNDFYTTGGHNLSSKISRVKSTTHYKQRTTSPTVDNSVAPKENTSPSVSTPKTTPASSGGKSISATPRPTPAKPSPTTRSRESVIQNSNRSHRGF